MTVRKSNMELLRIFSILFIISFHYVYKGDFVFDSSFGLNEYILKIFWHFGELGVNLFMLISGYFMVNSKFKVKKLILLIAQVSFYNILTLAIACGLGEYQISGIVSLVKELFPVTLNRFWFITAYIIVYVLSPYLNTLAHALSKSAYQKFLLTVLVMWSIIPTALGVFFGSTEEMLYYNRLIWIIIVYFVGGYIRLHPAKLTRSMKSSIITSAVAFGVLAVSVLIIAKFSGLFAKLGTTEIAYFWTPNTIPLFALSIGIFGIFTHINLSYNQIINRIASTTLGIYLLHDGVLVGLLWRTIFKNATHQDSPFLILYIIGSTLAVFAVGAVIDLIRQLIEKHTLQRLLNSAFADRITQKVRKLND